LSERGNALFLILIAVALFAALSYVVVRSSRTTGSMPKKESARMAASVIQNQMASLQTGLERLGLKCRQEQINFYYASVPVNYTNASSPSDNSCDLFHPLGGSSTYPKVQTEWLADGFQTDAYAHYSFFGNIAMDTNGTTCTQTSCAEVTGVLPHLSQDICQELNVMASAENFNASIPTETITGCPFTGTFDCSGNSTADVFFSNAVYANKYNFCYNDGNLGYTYIRALMVR
jgi:hypothetical protein